MTVDAFTLAIACRFPTAVARAIRAVRMRLILLRGIAAIVFGILAFIWPGITLRTLILFYGAFALVDGVLALAHAIMGGNVGSRWWLALVGVAGIAAGCSPSSCRA